MLFRSLVDGTTREELDPLTIDVPSTDRVRVMNLHKAKGLEAPVVFLADFQKRKTGEGDGDGPFLHVDRTGDRTTGWLAVTQSVDGVDAALASFRDEVLATIFNPTKWFTEFPR